MNNKNTCITLAAIGFSFSLMSAPVLAITLDPGDLQRLPGGTNLALLYLQNVQNKGAYSNGDKVDKDAKLDVNLSILRFVHFMDVGDYTMMPQVMLPVAELQPKGSFSEGSTNNGVGDLIFINTIHLIKDPNPKKAFEIVPYLYVPTGKYDPDSTFNVGENRWKAALQLGYMTPLSERFTLEVAADATLFGDNDKYTAERVTLKQKPLYEAQSHLTYNLTDKTFLAGTFSYSWGGETEVDGVDQHNDNKRTKALFSVGHALTPSVHVLASYGQDFDVEEGLKEQNRFNLRLLKVF